MSDDGRVEVIPEGFIRRGSRSEAGQFLLWCPRDAEIDELPMLWEEYQAEKSEGNR